MDLQQLLHMLRQGIRLPNPDFCPLQLSTLIQKCFLENPKDRPSFEDIKTAIGYAYNALITAVDPDDITKSEDSVRYFNVGSIDKTKDDEMKQRYLNMIRENQNRQHQKRLSPINEQPGDQSQTFSSVPRRIQSSRYLSLIHISEPTRPY